MESQGRRKLLLLVGLAVLIAGVYVGVSVYVPGQKNVVSSIGPTKPKVVSESHRVQEQPRIHEFQVEKSGRLLFVNVTVCGQSVRMLLDTGCTRTGLDNRFRPLLGEVLETTELKTFAGSIQADVFSFPDMQLGDLPIGSTRPIFCHDFREMQAITGEDVWGVIGMDVLRNFVAQIDFDEGKLRLSKEIPESAEGLGTKVQLVFKDGDCASLVARCGTTERHFMVDTGSNKTCIEANTFTALAATGEIFTGSFHSAGGPGGMSSSQAGLIQTLKVGPFVHSEVRCDKDAISVLGLCYLSRYHVTFDFPRGTAYLRQGKAFHKKDPRGVSGLWPSRSARGFVVKSVAPQGPAELAGVKVGDEIVEIEDKPTSEMDLFTIGEVLTCTPGQQLHVKFIRNEQLMRTVILTRDRFAGPIRR